MNKPGPRPKCPQCGAAMRALYERPEPGSLQPYRDPVDGARLFACREHGRVAVTGEARPEAGQ